MKVVNRAPQRQLHFAVRAVDLEERRVRLVGVRRGFLATPCLAFDFYSAAFLVVFSTITKRLFII